MNSDKFKSEIDDATQKLYEFNHYLATQITRLGYPSLTISSIPTAGVMWDEKRKKVNFIFNKLFYESLTEEQLIFILAHEASHVFHGHIFTMWEVYSKADRDPTTSKFETQQWLRKFNKAADCVVNDSLVNLHGLPKVRYVGYFLGKAAEDHKLSESVKNPEHLKDYLECNPDLAADELIKKGSSLKIPTHPLWGKEVVKTDCHDLTVENVMLLMPEQDCSEGTGTLDSHEFWKNFVDGNGNFDPEFVKKMQGVIQENLENSDLSQQEKEAVEKLQKIMEKSSDSNVQKAGKEASSSRVTLDGHSNDSLQWRRLLADKLDMKQTEDTWDKPVRSLISVYPDVLLPRESYKETQSIFLAIDVSDSIDMNTVQFFLRLAKNTPKNFQVEGIVFNTHCTKVDVRNDKDFPVGGGTSFSIIEDYIQNNLPQYPKAIFVLTDGHGDDVEPQHPGRWTWLLYGSSSTHNIGNMTHHDIEKMLRSSTL